ncbi:MAG: helix-turn-helix domain-containing protein [Proteobacteria bacterium]|nr:helix-turn-helix domain-containing protein [Pseudomonadota bacterium]
MKPENRELAANIGTVLRGAREASKLTQGDIAVFMDLSEAFYQRIETGNALPSIQTFYRLRSLLNLSADDILNGNFDRDSYQPIELPPELKPSGQAGSLMRRIMRSRPFIQRIAFALLRHVQEDISPEKSQADEHKG